jgi:hypothetical protein
MGKIILEFDSNEEADLAKDAMNASSWKVVIWELDQQLRNTTKYQASVIKNKDLACEIESKIAEIYREKIKELLEKYNLSIW